MRPQVVGDVVIGLSRLARAIPCWRIRTLRILRRDGLTLGALAAIAAVKNPAGTALVDDSGPLSYGELDQRSDELARRLPPGIERIGVLHGNARDFAIAVIAGTRIGADVVLLNPASTPTELQQIHDTEYLDLLLPSSTGPCGSDESVPTTKRRGRVVVLTSGSTGAAKGVDRGDVRVAQVLPVATLVRRLPLRAGTPMVVTPPLFHGFGLGFLALGLAFGMPVVLSRRFDADHVATYLRDHPGCLLIGVPPVLARIERAEGTAEGSRAGGRGEVGAVVSGAGLLHPAVAARLSSSYGPVLFNLYGSSEEGWSTMATPADLAAAPGTIGRPAAGVRVEVLDDAGRPVPVGVTGHLCISSRLEFSHYTGGQVRRRLGGLADSGDLGHRDQAGRFFVDGRADDMVVTGGENVFTTEVENALLSHPAVEDVRVDGLPDQEFGARLEAFVVRRGAVEADELIAHARARLARHKLPRAVHFVEELPRTATGKPRRHVT